MPRNLREDGINKFDEVIYQCPSIRRKLRVHFELVENGKKPIRRKKKEF